MNHTLYHSTDTLRAALTSIVTGNQLRRHWTPAQAADAATVASLQAESPRDLLDAALVAGVITPAIHRRIIPRIHPNMGKIHYLA